MDFLPYSPALPAATKLHPKRAGVSSSGGSLSVRDIHGVQDQQVLKKQKRMEANRVSAQNSRLRKQAELDDLKHKAETLINENQSLRDEVQRLTEECKKLASENNSMKEHLIKIYGPDIISKEDNGATPIRFFF